MKDRSLVIGLSAAAILLGLVLVFFAFGTPQAPQGFEGTASGGTQAGAPSGASSGSDGSGHGELGSTTATGEVPAPDPDSPLAIEIPGCVCHSDDPQIVEEHAQYRMNQCFGCHAEGMPGMGG